MEIDVESKLVCWRAEIDLIDAELLRLINRRAQIVLTIAGLKQRAGLAFYDPHRERKILARVKQINVGPMSERAITKIFRRIILESRRNASSPRIEPE